MFGFFGMWNGYPDYLVAIRKLRNIFGSLIFSSFVDDISGDALVITAVSVGNASIPKEKPRPPRGGIHKYPTTPISLGKCGFSQ